MSKNLSDTTELLDGIKNWIENSAVAKESTYSETSGNARGAQNIVNALGSEVSMGSQDQPIYLSNGAFLLCNQMSGGGGGGVGIISFDTATASAGSGYGEMGCVRFENGLMIKWDKVSVPKETTKDFNYPFSQYPWVAEPASMGAFHARASWSLYSTSLTKYTAGSSGGSAYVMEVCFVGRWKTVSGGGGILDMVYPVGSIYMSMNNVSPQTFIGGTWSLLDSGYWLMSTSSGGGSKVNAELPNIKGELGNQYNIGTAYTPSATSALYSKNGVPNGGSVTSGANTYNALEFDASRSNSIYKDGATVQPQSYKVYMWQRIS